MTDCEYWMMQLIIYQFSMDLGISGWKVTYDGGLSLISESLHSSLLAIRELRKFI